MIFFIGAVVVLLGYGYAVSCQMLPKDQEWIRNRNFAHRGYYTKDQIVPENSMAAFIRALDHGYAIEMDVQLSKDGKVFVFHDDDLMRMVDKTKAGEIPSNRVTDLTYEQLSHFPLGNSDERIPLLTEVLKRIGGQVPIYLEIKDFRRNCKPICNAVMEILQDYNGKIAIASFNPYVLYYFRKKAPQYLRIQIAQDLSKSLSPWWQKVLLQNLLLNGITRPHAVSYQYDKTNLSFRLSKLLGGYTLGWSISSQEAYDKYHHLFDSIVFDHYEADRFHQAKK